MALWRVHLRPDAHTVDPVEICIRQGVVGIGWRVPRVPRSRDEYWNLGEKEYGYSGWRKAANAVGWRMSDNDLVWVRDFFGSYYVGRISGGWEYRHSPENLDADIVNVRPCKLHEVGPNVAGSIINSFNRGATAQRIHDETAELFSEYTISKITNTSFHYSPRVSLDIFRLLSYVDLEDIVSFFLQMTKGYIFTPSSRAPKNTTIAHEYRLFDRSSGEINLVQVKSGDQRLNPADYYSSPYKFYLFSPDGYAAPSERRHVVCLERRDIEKFLWENRSVFPFHISAWLDLYDEVLESNEG